MFVHGSMDIDFGLFMAAATLATVPSLLVFVLLRRYIFRGVTLASGIKG
jgi:ABC-type maltose transport system permease subunit